MATIDDVYNKVDALSTQVASLRELVEGMNEVFSGHVVTILNKAESNRAEIVGDINQSKTDIFELVNSQSDLLREHVTGRCTNTTNAVNGHSNQIKADIFEELTRQIGEDAGGRTLHQHINEADQSILAATNGLQTGLNNAKGSIEEKIVNQHAQTRNNLEAKMQMCLEASNLNTSDVAESTKGTILNTVVGNLQSAKGEIMSGIGSTRNAIESAISSAVGTHSEAGQPQTLHQHIESSRETLRTDIEDVSSEISVVRSTVMDGNNLVTDKVDVGVSTIRQEATTNKETILTAVQNSDATIQQKIESGNTSILNVLSDVNDNVNQKASATIDAVTSQIQLSAQDIINAITGVDPSMLLEVIQQSLNAVMRNEMIKDDTERALVGALVIALVRTQLGDKKFEELTNVLERVKYAPASAVEQGMMVGEPVDSPLSVYYQLFNSTKKKPTPNRLSPEFGDANSKE